LESKIRDESFTSLTPLPDETICNDSKLEGDSIDEEETVAILYGHVGTTAFASLYKALKQAGTKFVVRHMGYIPYEEEISTKSDVEGIYDNMSSRAIPTVLQGYGVRLDIRNVEYKAFDDGPNDKTESGTLDIDWTDACHKDDDPARDEYLAGVNLNSFITRFGGVNNSSLPTDLKALQTALIQSHPTQLRSESIVPPAWQRRSLSLQAATMISSSSDPLEALQGISQNLPSIAHSLSKVVVPDTLEDLASEATDLAAKVGAVSHGWGDAAFGFFINSREVDVERPSFNVFHLLDILKEEDKILRGLEDKVRPMLAKTVTALGQNAGEVGDAGWAALQAVRKMKDMGSEKLILIGKKGIFEDEASLDESNFDPDDEYDDDGNSAKYRIDVGRGGKNAILYLNDIEKDPEYRSWPTSMQQMFYSSQFGGAPTVRRNLFTLLIVIDPASNTHHPAVDVAAQLLNSQFPLRLGVLIVDNYDVSNGTPSAPFTWNRGERPFHSRDSFLLMHHITKKYGGMAAISCLLRVLNDTSDLEDKLSVGNYIGMHVALLAAMNVIGSGREDLVQKEMEDLLKAGESEGLGSKANDSKKEPKYENAVQFALDKMIHPGMSFLNGIPLPESNDMRSFGMGVNDILQYEQRHIMELAMKGVITDTAPRSVYATILSGDHLFKQFHPLLRESNKEYLLLGSKSDESSLIFTSSDAVLNCDIDAIFVVEGVFDLDNADGVEAALSFLDVIISPPETWHDSKAVSAAFRIHHFATPTKPTSLVLSNLFCHASSFDVADIKAVTAALYKQADNEDVRGVIEVIKKITTLKKDVNDQIVQLVGKREICPPANARKSPSTEQKNFYTANGRVYVPYGNPSISAVDIKMIINLEMHRANAMTKLLLPHLLPPSFVATGEVAHFDSRLIHNAVGKSLTILNEIMSTSNSKSKNVSSEISRNFSPYESTTSGNPLHFSWNDESSSGHLQIEVSVILDPLTEPTQRVAPLLIVIRDFLKLPLKVVIAPRVIVENDLPLSSYYRFVANPFAQPHMNQASALFQNLPTTHVLTLRMDVPEPWDTQQTYAIQDSDNLRCDVRNGCRDRPDFVSDKHRSDVVELANIEYGLKGLLFFGQCYDVSKNTPPNGLQLTLDRSELNSLSESSSYSEISIEADGSIAQADERVKPIVVPIDHTDTLVMKTVGYWQLRANPGVWTLRIADGTRGSDIYHMVDGTISPSGKMLVSKDATERVSKTLVMKDFSNHGQLLLVKRRQGFEDTKLFEDDETKKVSGTEDEIVHVFSLATGHAYERLLKIMMLSVTKRTSSKVKFWLFENFLSPSFKSSAKYMAEKIGCEVEFVTYKWPEWLRGQSEKQRLIWGYKILFLDVLFPLDVKKIIYVDADQVIRGDLTELWNLDLDGAPYGYTPFCDSREETLGYQFWRTGFWKSHLRGKPYHISALYVVDLERFRRELVGDKLRAIYQQLSADPNSLANLDQDLPNYAQHDVRIFSLPQKWLWCESWCSDETKAEAMTIDLCNNPLHKEAKIAMAKRIISGELFEESWEELDEQVGNYEKEFLASQGKLE